MPTSDERLTPAEQAERYLAAHKVRGALGDAYRRAFDSPDGKTVLVDLFRKGGFFESSVVPGENERDCGKRDGRRVMVLEILEQLRWSEFEILALSRERTAEQINAAQGEG